MISTLTRASIVLCLAALGACALAYPTLMGMTGTGVLPNAMSAPAGDISIAVDMQDNNTDTTKAYRLVYGLSNRFELGVAFTDTQRETWAGTAKFKISPNTAIGALYGSTSELVVVHAAPQETLASIIGKPSFTTMPYEDITLPRTTSYQVYAVHTLQLAAETEDYAGIAASLGVNWSGMDNDDMNVDAFRVFGSVEMKKGPIALVADIQSADTKIDDKVMTSIALRVGVGQNLAAQVGFTNSLGVLGGTESRLFGGVNLTM